MTRKDYVSIAAAMREALSHPDVSPRSHRVMAELLAKYLKEDNGNFKKDRFLDACGCVTDD